MQRSKIIHPTVELPVAREIIGVPGGPLPSDSNNPETSANEEKEPEYFATEEGTFWRNPNKEGQVVKLANFSAKIVADVRKDDGVDTTRALDIEVRLKGKTISFTIPAANFLALSWVTPLLGGSAIIMPGAATKDRLRAAIQYLSNDIKERMVLTHTGWHETSSGWVYAHRGGAIGQHGAVTGIEVELPVEMAPFMFPQIAQGAELVAAISTMFTNLFEVAPPDIIIPTIAAVMRSIIPGSDFSLGLVGPTGQFKSELAALAQQFFGAGFDARHLPAAWSSTENALEAMAFTMKDAVLVMDDYNLLGGDRKALNRKADHVLRAQGNQRGRSRLRSDTSSRPAKWPRGLIEFTGEEVPSGQSLLARVLIVDIARGAIDAAKLTLCQKDAADGVYAKVTAAFIKHLAPKLDEIRECLALAVQAARTESSGGGRHRRYGDIIANLVFAWDLFIDFTIDAGAFSAEDAEGRREWARAALESCAEKQAGLQSIADPSERFFELLNSAISSGKAHVANPIGNEPKNPWPWGWRLAEHGDGVWRPQGDCIGWIRESAKSYFDSDDLFLDPVASYKIACEMARNESVTLPSPVTLWKELHQRGHLVSTDKDTKRQTLKVQRKVQGKLKTVLHLRAGSLGGPTDVDTDDTAALNGNGGRRHN